VRSEPVTAGPVAAVPEITSREFVKENTGLVCAFAMAAKGRSHNGEETILKDRCRRQAFRHQ
jgi:hypothetical protein